MLHFQKTSDSSNESARLGFYKQTTLRKYTLHWSRTRRNTESFITQCAEIHKIGLLLSRDLIFVKARMLKAKAMAKD